MFDPKQHTPIIDNITFNVRYNLGLKWNSERYVDDLNKKFNRLCKIIEDDIGRPLQKKDYGMKYYVPGYGITLHRPTLKYGWGRIHFQPTKLRLEDLQRWLRANFGHDLTGIISFTSIELAYDYHCPDLMLEDYDRLALRIGASLTTRNGIYQFAVAIINKDCKGKICTDGAINGSVTVYIQSAKRKGRAKHSDELKVNKKAAGHTKIYGKEIGHRQFIRIEHTLNNSKAKRVGIIFNPNNLPGILNLPNLPFSKFWEFKQVDLLKFIPCFETSNPFRNIRKRLWHSFLYTIGNYPVADYLRYMSCAVNGNKRLERLKCSLVKKLGFEQVINMPLPDDFHVSQRNGNMTLPDDAQLPDNIKLSPFIHKQLKQPIIHKQLKQPRGMVQQKLF